ncbi:MAG: hypothetical protein IT450_03795 [Phycisphaerales bacterium]|nr:hypothetical protein [Phycisphaerales bacterium]
MRRQFSAILLGLSIGASAEIGYRPVIIRLPVDRSLYVSGVNDAGTVTGEAILDEDGRQHLFRWSAGGGIEDLGALVLPGQSGGHDINNSGQIAAWTTIANGDVRAAIWTADSGFAPLNMFWWGTAPINDLGWIGGLIISGPQYDAAAIWRPGIGYTILGDLPGGERYAFPTAINNAGTVCGRGTDADNVMRAFIWDAANGLRAMPTMPNGARASTVTGLNNLGQVVGSCYESVPFGYLWDPATGYSRLEFGPDFDQLEPLAINDRTEIIGGGYTGTSFFPWVFDPRHGYRYLNEHIDPCVGPLNRLSPRDINNVGQILCYSREGTMGSAFGYLLTPYVKGDLDGDNVVDLSDLVILLSNFGRTGDADYSAGDLDCDADVDLQDLATQLSGFGESYP